MRPAERRPGLRGGRPEELAHEPHAVRAGEGRPFAARDLRRVVRDQLRGRRQNAASIVKGDRGEAPDGEVGGNVAVGPFLLVEVDAVAVRVPRVVDAVRRIVETGEEEVRRHGVALLGHVGAGTHARHAV